MTIALVRHVTTGPGPFPDVAPAAVGNLMIASYAIRNGSYSTSITGWVNLSPGGSQSVSTGGNTRYHTFFYRFAQAGDGVNSFGVNSAAGGVLNFAEFSGVGAILGSVAQAGSGLVICGGPITVTAPCLIVGGMATAMINDTDTFQVTPTSPNIELEDKACGAGAPGFWMGYQVASGAGTYSVNGTQTCGIGQVVAGVTAAFVDLAALAQIRSFGTIVGA